ncbi:MAG: hypothetical protein ACREL6_13235 [Gemmatimonadales bacterium]
MTRVGASVITGAAIGAEAAMLSLIARLVGGNPPTIPDLSLIMVWSLVYSVPFALVLSFLLPGVGRAVQRNSRTGWLISGALLGAVLGLGGFVAAVRSPASLVLPVLAVTLFGATAGVLLHILLRPAPAYVTPVTPPPGSDP